MKFILNEKFILDDRAILQEDQDEETPEIDYIQELKKLAYLIETKLQDLDNNKQFNIDTNEKTITDLQNILNNSAKKIEQDFNTAQSLEIINKHLTEYLNVFNNTLGKQAVNKITTQYPDIKNALRRLDDQREYSPSTPEEKEKKRADISMLFNLLHNAVIKLLENSAPGSNNTEAKLIAEIKHSCTDIINRITQIINNFPDQDFITKIDPAELVKVFTTINTALRKFLNAIPTKVKIMGSLDSFNKTCTEFLLTCDEMDNLLKNLSIKEKNGVKNWAQLLTDAKGNLDDLSAIWDDYYETEWPKYKEAVINLGNTFINDLLDYGFDENTNIRITFLKQAFKYNLPIKAISYSIISTALKNNILSVKDIQNTKPTNLIYNKKFYEATPATMQKLLTLQKTILNLTPNDLLNKDLKNRYADNMSQLATDLLFKEGNPLINNKQGSPDNDIKPINQIRQELEAITVKNQENTTIETPKQVINADQIITDLSRDKKAITDFIKFLISETARDKAEFIQLLQKYNIGANTTIQIAEIQKFLSIIKKYSLRRDEIIPTIESLIKFIKEAG